MRTTRTGPRRAQGSAGLHASVPPGWHQESRRQPRPCPEKIQARDIFPMLDSSWHLPYRQPRGLEVRRFIDVDGAFNLDRFQPHPAFDKQCQEAAKCVESRAARVGGVVENSSRQEIESCRHHRSLTVAQPQDQPVCCYICEKRLAIAAPSRDSQHAHDCFVATMLDFLARLINKTR